MGLINRTKTVEATLAAAVADTGNFTIAYPTGTSQVSYNAGLLGPGSYLMLNSNEKLTEASTDITLAFGATEITVTNSSGFTWAAGTDVMLSLDQRDGNDIVLLSIPVALAAVTAAGDVVTEIRPGIYGTVEAFDFVTGRPATTAAKLASFNLEIDTTNVTGGVIALTSANATPLGKMIAGSAITAANTLTLDSKLSIEASAVTAFVEGDGFFLIRIRKTYAYNS